MTKSNPTNIAASVRARLRNQADDLGLSFTQVLQYYAMERFLYRLSKTEWVDSFIVKGAAMLRVWDGAVARPTKDIDFLGTFDTSSDLIRTMIAECLVLEIEDGISFSPEIEMVPITVENRYPGSRVRIRGELSGAQIVLQLDIGIADAAIPEPGWVNYPTLLDHESPRILAYHPATSIAEKFQTMIEKGLLNSRVKDYYDILILSHTVEIDGNDLYEAIQATFSRRVTVVPD